MAFNRHSRLYVKVTFLCRFPVYKLEERRKGVDKTTWCVFMLVQNSLGPVVESYIPWSDFCAPKLVKCEKSLNDTVNWIS